MISVVIPMFNSKKTIAECINSVVNQTREDLIGEIIVIDDGSADGSAELVECRYSSYKKLRVIRKRNEGVSSARNMGIKAAKYDWIALLDLIAARHIHRAELNAKQRRDHHAKTKQTIRKADRHIWKKHLPQRVHSEQQQTGRQCDPSPHTPPKQTQEILRKLCLIQHK